MLNILISLTFWSLVLLCFLVQARILDLPLSLVPTMAFVAAWLFVILERRKILRQEILLLREQAALRRARKGL